MVIQTWKDELPKQLHALFNLKIHQKDSYKHLTNLSHGS